MIHSDQALESTEIIWVVAAAPPPRSVSTPKYSTVFAQIGIEVAFAVATVVPIALKTIQQFVSAETLTICVLALKAAEVVIAEDDIESAWTAMAGVFAICAESETVGYDWICPISAM